MRSAASHETLPPALTAGRAARGFTLLEVMLVLLLMGLAAGYVVFNAISTDPAEQLEREARRLQVVIDMASDYAVLNQQQLGIRIDEENRTYSFMRLNDEDEWQFIEEQKVYEPVTLTEPFFFTLTLDDLPWEEGDRLFERDMFDNALSVNEQDINVGEEEPPPPPPQILIMSSGEITPFSLVFHYEPDFSGNQPAYFVLNNRDVPPLEFLGPLDQPDWEQAQWD
ncbi:type II secretion system minor pseudopilin GspH [Alteromonas gilva]|uniref:Type II secretion system protein H n=1 Tax=Alteromonas gilva TaxID=2987522 RepID=A0ABT5KX50_9ALTE|nr:type II secretion system minor pseudopilin GspH [Alteromonas gilva]MDC8829345.1 type II secretion system minor pseudopilin GspH [Alteromonas gilva]